MDISGEYRIPAPREKVWEALNDPAMLQAAIPGCEALEKVSATDFTTRICSRIGAIKARFNGNITLSDIDAPNSYTISGQGQGGIAGMAKGSARVALETDGDETILRYNARADVAGKLATVGSRVIEGVAKKTADDFFRAFVVQVTGEGAPAASGDGAVAVAQDRRPAMVWLVGIGVAAAVAAGIAALLL